MGRTAALNFSLGAVGSWWFLVLLRALRVSLLDLSDLGFSHALSFGAGAVLIERGECVAQQAADVLHRRRVDRREIEMKIEADFSSRPKRLYVQTWDGTCKWSASAP